MNRSIVLFAPMFVLLSGCEILERHKKQKEYNEPKSIVGLSRNSYIRPLLGLNFDVQGSVPIEKLKHLPEELHINEKWSKKFEDDDIRPSPMVDLRFIKVGIENRLTDFLRLDLYADAALTFGYFTTGEVMWEDGLENPYIAATYSPAVIPAFNAELYYIFGKEKEAERAFHIFIGARYREFDLRIEKGHDWHESPKFYEADSYQKIVDISQKSVFIGVGTHSDSELYIIQFKIGLEFNDVDVQDRYRGIIEIERSYPNLFGGLDIGFRF